MAQAKKSNKDSTESLRRQLKDLSRELEIEAALEKVRSKAMSMRSSDMLAGTSAVMFQQIKALGIDATRCGVGIFDDANDAMEVWLTTASAGDKVMRVLDYVNLHIHPVYENILAARKKKKPYAITVLQGEEVRNYYNTMSVYMAGTGRKVANKQEAYQSFFFDQGTINITTANPLSEEERSIMVRFAKVFGLIYLRFVDLQKAEAQASEARIEASLERVRSRSLAMRKSVELSDVAVILYQELRSLGVTNFFNCGFVEVDTQANIQYGWMTLPKGKRVEGFKLPLVGDPVLQERYEAWQRQDPVFYQSVGGAELKEHLKFVRLTIGSEDVDKKVTTKLPDPTVFYAFNFSHGYLHILSDGLLNADEELLATRFAKVFEIAYRRFLDLKVAEAQAQEAQIEAALERIRSRSLAMQRSQELMEVADVLREQMALLGQAELETSALHFYKEVPGHIVSWRAFRLGSKTKGKISKGKMLIPNDGCALVEEWLSNFNQGLQEYTIEVSGAKQKDWYKVLFRLAPEVGEAMVKQKATTETRYYHFSRFSGGALLMVAIKRPSEESIYLQRRAATVFDLAYRRFLDLKVAEAQAREAQIEAALEKVRSHSLAMQRSEQLRDVIRVVMEQFSKLGIPADLANFNFYTRTNDWSMWLARPGFAYAEKIHLPYIQHPLFDAPIKSGLKGATLYSDVLTRAEGRSAMKHFLRHTLVGEDPEAVASMKKAKGLARSIVFGSKIMLTISRYDAIPYDEEQNSILTRFANVFEQAYTRFLDLQKAETQAREAQIELALERIRARTMAMQKSEELAETAYVYFQQFKELGQSPEQFTIGLINETKRVIEFWHTWQGSLLEGKVEISIDEPHVGQKMYNTWKGEQHSAIIDLSGKELRAYNTYRKKQLAKANAKAPAEVLRSEKRRIIHIAPFSKGTISVTTHEPQTAETFHLLERFAKVFDQTYTRFLDLQRAEAQAREAQIEAALERVRASTMAMHKSEQLLETAKILFEQFGQLGKTPDRIGIGIMREEKEVVEWWVTHQKGTQATHLFESSIKQPTIAKFFSAWKAGSDSITVQLEGTELKEWIRFVREDVKMPLDDSQMKGKRVHHAAFFTHGLLLISHHDHFPEETMQLLIRFAKVFGQTYTRFLDLQKAEAQAREAQLETALERARSRSLAMHKSTEIEDVVAVVFTQLQQLGLNFEVIGIATRVENTNDLMFWIGNDQHSYANRFLLPYTDFGAGRDILAAMDNKAPFFSKVYTFEEKNRFWSHAFANSGFKALPESRKEYILKSDSFSLSVAPVNGVVLLLIDYTGKVATEQESELVKRFARVFEQCYVRFQDLEKVEAQAREATIQASLERVRAKAMAMHSSQDLAETIYAFYSELVSLNLTPRRAGLGLINKETRVTEISTMSTTEAGISVEVIGELVLENHPVLEGVYDHWLRQAEYHPVLRGNEIKQYYQLIRKNLAFPDYPNDAVQFGYFFFFEEGGIYAWTDKELQEDELNIYRRFTSVLSLTYRRYKDLKDSEARAKEAVKQASLDRVRAEIASMRHADDLQRITPLVWRELTTLGVPFFRCGVMIVHEKEHHVDFYLSTPEGKPLAALHLDSNGQEVTKKAMDHWRRQAVYTDHWDREQFAAFAQDMVKAGQVQNASAYQGGELPPESMTLQFSPFAQGMLYVGSEHPLSTEQLELVHALADAFSTAYARYEDFTRLESAKATVERALSELRTTQNQLVQSEKMASLGELTAGIAHEIQNPLNFVNNFSEVSKELLEEMEAELKNGNQQDALQIAKDIIQNLEKINYHGKRADGIVKSMLQHSRKSTGQKELTDINALCDEYLRLAYHGLRAKDKSFNAKFETGFDPSVGQISVLPQEIGRVVLNLINNAFYAVSEKKKLNLESYEPTVTVTTRKSGNTIEIRVTDNGTGIPQKALDKIFNPFFTTKPTGQGTGLGLSLSYDIITKGHGGELTVKTMEGEGSEFHIQLPIA